MLGFDALDAQPPGDESSSPGKVPRANADQVNFKFTGTAATRGTDFSWAPAVASYTGAGAATLGVTAAAAGQHSAPVSGVGTGAAALAVSASAQAAHGVAGAGAATLGLNDSASAGHGIAGAEAAALTLTASGGAAHGIAGTVSVGLACTAAGVAQHPRYEVRGSVMQGGILINRRVRVYNRTTGALVGEGDTVTGKFNLHTGFAPAEHYVVPVNLADDATDWLPPVANRVLSVLAQDV